VAIAQRPARKSRSLSVFIFLKSVWIFIILKNCFFLSKSSISFAFQLNLTKLYCFIAAHLKAPNYIFSPGTSLIVVWGRQKVYSNKNAHYAYSQPSLSLLSFRSCLHQTWFYVKLLSMRLYCISLTRANSVSVELAISKKTV